MPRLLPLLLLTSGCGPVFKLVPEAKRACTASIVELSDDLAIKVDNGPGDGSFDYAYEGWSLLAKTAGEYDLKTGDFSWINNYADGSQRTEDNVVGSGTVWRDGNFDLEYDNTVSFKDGTILLQTTRAERTGCTQSTRVELGDGTITLTDATWNAGGLDWTRNFVVGPAAVEGIGHMNADRSWFETVNYDDGTARFEWASDGDGNNRKNRTFDDDDGWSKTKGSWEAFYDGTVVMNFTLNNPNIEKETWDFTVDGLGAGGGTWSNASDTCDLVFTNGNCKWRNCSDVNLEGKCDVPVPWPEY